MSLSQPSSTDGKGNRWKCHYDSSRKFKSEWQKKYPWIEQATDGSGDAFCSLCRMNIAPRLSNVARHEGTAKHTKKASSVSRNSKITSLTPKENERVKEMELQLALAITCHSSIMAVDHLGEIMVNNGRGSNLEHIRLHEEGIPSDSVSFWSGVLTYRNGRFGDLARYALACLTTPTSNAVVERMFSYVTGIKTKSRNKLSSCMLEAIVRIRTNLYFKGICCKDVKPTPRMFKLFNTKNMYRNNINDQDVEELSSSDTEMEI